MISRTVCLIDISKEIIKLKYLLLGLKLNKLSNKSLVILFKILDNLNFNKFFASFFKKYGIISLLLQQKRANPYYT